MLRAWDKEKIWIPDRIRTYDLPNTGRALYPLELRRTHGERGHTLGSPLSTTSTLLILAVCTTRVKYEPETHKGLKRVTLSMLVNIHFYRIWKPSEGYPFSTKLLPRDHYAVVTGFLHFKVKTKNGKRKFKRMPSFLFVEAFHKEIVLRGIQLCFLYSGAQGLF